MPYLKNQEKLGERLNELKRKWKEKTKTKTKKGNLIRIEAKDENQKEKLCNLRWCKGRWRTA